MNSTASLLLCSALLCGSTMRGQDATSLPSAPQPTASLALVEPFSPGDPRPLFTDATTSAAVVSSQPTKDPLPLSHRFLDLQTFAHGQRFRSAAHSGGVHFIKNAQQRTWAVGHFKLDAEDRYQIGFRASSGHYFNWAYADIYGNSFTKIISNKPLVKSTYTSDEWASAPSPRTSIR